MTQHMPRYNRTRASGNWTRHWASSKYFKKKPVILKWNSMILKISSFLINNPQRSISIVKPTSSRLHLRRMLMDLWLVSAFHVHTGQATATSLKLISGLLLPRKRSSRSLHSVKRRTLIGDHICQEWVTWKISKPSNMENTTLRIWRTLFRPLSILINVYSEFTIKVSSLLMLSTFISRVGKTFALLTLNHTHNSSSCSWTQLIDWLRLTQTWLQSKLTQRELWFTAWQDLEELVLSFHCSNQWLLSKCNNNSF